MKQWIIENPAYFFVLAAIAICTIANMHNRWLRSQNIRAKGWPPPHLDADGDFQQTDDEKEAHP